MQSIYILSQVEGVILTSFITPFPHLVIYVVLQFLIKKAYKRESLPEWVKRWLFVAASILTLFAEFLFVSIMDRNAEDKSGGMILLFPMMWTFLFIIVIFIAEVFIQIVKLFTKKRFPSE